MPLFSPPYVVELPTTVDRRDRTYSKLGNRLFRHYAPRGPVGRSVLKINGTWQTINMPTTDQIESCDWITDTHGQKVRAYFAGGHVHPVTQTVADALTAAGYTVLPDPIIPTIVPYPSASLYPSSTLYPGVA